MARRYDSRTTIFSPEGRIYQVEYAIEAISQAGSAVGVRTKEGVVLAAEKRILSKLLDRRSKTEKMYKIDDHVSVVVAGITSDANILINYARLEAQRYYQIYQEPIPLEHLLQIVYDLKQAYTQYGGMRPFGVSFLWAGWDKHFGFQLYQSDPSGNYGEWKAQAIGNNYQAAQSILRQEFKKDEDEEKGEKKEDEEEELKELSLKEALLLSMKVLSKTMDTTSPTPDKLEIATVTREGDQVKYHILTKKELKEVIKEFAEFRKKEQEKEKAKESAQGDF